MNAFRQCIQDLALTFESQGTGNEYSWLFVLLSMMADSQDSNPVDPLYPANPVKEVLHRLRAYSDSFAVQRTAQILNRYVSKYPA
jgi:hypothetical protein